MPLWHEEGDIYVFPRKRAPVNAGAGAERENLKRTQHLGGELRGGGLFQSQDSELMTSTEIEPEVYQLSFPGGMEIILS